MIVRPARLEELEQLAALLMPAQLEMPALFAATLPRSLEHLRDAYRRGVILVATVKGRAVGAMILFRQRVQWGDGEFLADSVTYVQPAARASGAAVALVKAARVGAGRLGLPLMLGRLSGPENGVLDRWYRMQGGVTVGARCFFPCQTINLPSNESAYGGLH